MYRYNRVLLCEPRKSKRGLKQSMLLARNFLPYWCRKLLGMPPDPDPKKQKLVFDEIPAKSCLVKMTEVSHGPKATKLMERFVKMPLNSQLSEVEVHIVK